MPGRLFLRRNITQVVECFGIPSTAIVISPRRNITPGQNILVCDAGGQLAEMRWGIVPVGRVNARGRPVMQTIVNVRSETFFEKSAFLGMQRCLVPADGWYEWTGARRKKTAWRISRNDGGLMCFAALCDFWRAPNGTKVAQVATVTCPPSADVCDIHDRMGVILKPEDFRLWLTGTHEQARDLMVPLKNGTLHTEEAVGVDWSAA